MNDIVSSIPLAAAHITDRWFNSAIVVPKCPYCGHAHYHHIAKDGNLERMSECLNGMYILDFTGGASEKSEG